MLRFISTNTEDQSQEISAKKPKHPIKINTHRVRTLALQCSLKPTGAGLPRQGWRRGRAALLTAKVLQGRRRKGTTTMQLTKLLLSVHLSANTHELSIRNHDSLPPQPTLDPVLQALSNSYTPDFSQEKLDNNIRKLT